MKFYLQPYGCQMNHSDMERIITVLEGMGYQKTDEESRADILGLVACSVRQKAIDRAYGRIHKWNKLKISKNIITFISGCVLPGDEKKFLKLFDLVVKIEDIPKLPDIIDHYGLAANIRNFNNQSRSHKELHRHIYWDISPQYISSFNAYVPIQDGCDKFCSFCAVPYTRGREVSRPSGDILKEVRRLIEKDYRSITLLGQNVNSYGLDKKGSELLFSELLEEVGKLGESSKKELWIYFISPNPQDMTIDTLKVMSKYKCIADQVHLPLQSGDDEVLRRMNRKYTFEEYCKIVKSVREILPKATLFTDIIVGFAGETESQFVKTHKAMLKFAFNMAYIACYSPRQGTAGAKLKDSVSNDEKDNRFRILTKDLNITSGRHNKSLIGKTRRVLIEAPDRKPGYLSGRTEGRIPVRVATNNHKLIGCFADVKIISAVSLSIEGKLLS